MSNTINITPVEVNGKLVHLVDGTARSGKPEWNQFHDRKVNENGVQVDERLSTGLFFTDENGETVYFRTTFWGEAALDAKSKLYDSQRIVKIQVRNARISSKPYFDRQGNEKYSLNINFKSQYKRLEDSEYWEGMGSDVEPEVETESTKPQPQPLALPEADDTAPF